MQTHTYRETKIRERKLKINLKFMLNGGRERKGGSFFFFVSNVNINYTKSGEKKNIPFTSRRNG